MIHVTDGTLLRVRLDFWRDRGFSFIELGRAESELEAKGYIRQCPTHAKCIEVGKAAR